MGFPSGILTVNLYEAKDLKSEDLFGKNDPYVELWLDEDYKQKSSEIKNSDNPVWNETFTFNIPQGSSDKKLYLKVLDKDLTSSDKIGEAKVNIKDIINSGRKFDEWVKLPAKLGLSSHGEIHLGIDFIPN
ncbi:C2 domain-containing protein [Fennellomyces sp. T-0311]|nr:C2 domain-containing protein [Fennellomyces sp. T-0311]